MHGFDAHSTVSRPLLRVTGAAILVIVAVVYVASLRAGHWPPGNPWSGFTLGMQAVFMVAVAGVQPHPAFHVLKFAAAALGLTGALFWMAAAFIS